MAVGVFQTNGSAINVRDWIRITFNDGGDYVGRFSGLYNNPTHGRMFYLSFARPVDGSKPPEAIYCAIREGNGCEEALDAAVVIEKPKIKDGKPVIKTLVPSQSTVH